MESVSTLTPNIQADKAVLASVLELGASFFPVLVSIDPDTGKCIKKPRVTKWQETSSFSIKRKEDLNGAFAYGFHPETIGAYVIDLDDKGTRGERELLDRLGGFCSAVESPSVYVDTPNGRHLYFSASGLPSSIIRSRNGILPGVDIRAEHSGGWLVAPGSVGYSIKRDAWTLYELEGDLANLPSMPEPLAELLVHLFAELDAKNATVDNSLQGPLPEFLAGYEADAAIAPVKDDRDPRIGQLFDLVRAMIKTPTFFERLVAIYATEAVQDKGNWLTGDYSGKKGRSCVWTPATGIIKDFADPGKGGDFLWLVEKRLACGPIEAARKILSDLGLPDPSASMLVESQYAKDDDSDDDALASAQVSANAATAQVTRLFPCTDSGNAERFAIAAENQLVYNSDQGLWLYWDGHAWLTDASGVHAQRLSKDVARSMSREAMEATKQGVDKRYIKDLAKWSKTSEMESRRNSMISLARAEHAISRPDSAFDHDLDALNTKSGLVNLKTGSVIPNAPDQFCTQVCGYGISDAIPKRFLEFLSDIFVGDSELLAWVHNYLGYCITGRTSEQIFPIWWGQGQNGKSQLLTVMGDLLGSYCKKTASDTWLQNRGNMPVRDDLAILRGARFVWASEPDTGKSLSVGIIKEVTGGDPITCRHLYGRPFTYMPTYKTAFVTNHRPMVKQQDFGTWRRLRFIPFLYRVPEEKKIPDLAQKLLAEEGEAILGWLVVGAMQWYKDGLPHCQTIIDSTAELKRSDDPLSEWITQDCVLGAGTQCGFDNLWTDYMNWNQQKGIHQYLSRQIFRRILQERGDIEFTTARASTWCKGIGIREKLS